MVKFYTDDYFHIGHAHLGRGKPCQDYAFSGVYDWIGFGAVSDGCSSGRHTDIGSRVVTLSTATFFRQLPTSACADIPEVRRNAVETQRGLIKLSRESLGLEQVDMLATSSYVFLSPFGGLVHLRGDGAIAIVNRTGLMNLYSYNWNKNMPFYPAYADDNCARFIKEHGGELAMPALNVEHWQKKPGEVIVKLEENAMSIYEGILGVSHTFTAKEVWNEIAFVAVFTDGVSQVASTVGGSEILPWQDVVQQLIAFKNLNGDFAKRRIISYLKELRKKNIGPLDDIGYAVVRAESVEGESENGS